MIAKLTAVVKVMYTLHSYGKNNRDSGIKI